MLQDDFTFNKADFKEAICKKRCYLTISTSSGEMKGDFFPQPLAIAVHLCWTLVQVIKLFDIQHGSSFCQSGKQSRQLEQDQQGLHQLL